FGAPALVLPVLAGAMVLAVAGPAHVAPRPAVTLLALLFGRLHGDIARLEAAGACAVRIPEGRVALRVRVAEPVGDGGGRIEVRPLDAGCSGTVAARWPAGSSAPAGTVSRVAGRWIADRAGFARPRGMLVVQETRPVGAEPTLSDRLRNRITRSAERLYGQRAPMVEALIVGRRADLAPELRQGFSRSGLVHLLSISGFHIGLLAGWIVLLLRAAGLSRVRALVAGAGVAALYVVFLGWPSPAARAAVLAALLALGLIRQRRARADALLATSCLLVMIVDPWAVTDMSGWLSVAALWGAVTFSRWSDRALGPSVGWRTLASSVGATLATAPITAATLGSVALGGVLLNFAGIPLAAVAVPGVLLSLLADGICRPLAASLAAGSGAALDLLERTAVWGGNLPGGWFPTATGARAALPWLLLLAFALWPVRARCTWPEALRRWAWCGAAALWLGLGSDLAALGGNASGTLALHLLDVGQGDAAAIRTPGGQWVLVDAGPRFRGDDAGRRVVIPFLRRHGVRRIAAIVISHAHADHVGGASAVLEQWPAALVLEPGVRFDDPLYLDWLADVGQRGLRWHRGRPGDGFELDGVRFRLLHPDPAWGRYGEDLNEDSLVLLVEYGEFQALFAGDVGFPAEAVLRGRVGRVDVLKLGHHGSAGSTGDVWLDELHPCVAVASVGRNTYGHPAPATMERIRVRGIVFRRTDRDGTVTVTTDGSSMTVRSERSAPPYTTETTACSPTAG
ncbi:MAG: DNA internalization-related competence protein ComEC/Rec2, partial [Gemmatimonadota bacterium]